MILAGNPEIFWCSFRWKSNLAWTYPNLSIRTCWLYLCYNQSKIHLYIVLLNNISLSLTRNTFMRGSTYYCVSWDTFAIFYCISWCFRGTAVLSEQSISIMTASTAFSIDWYISPSVFNKPSIQITSGSATKPIHIYAT